MHAGDIVFLLDVDNTLLDNDRFKADLDARLEHDFGRDGRERYWALYESERDGSATPTTSLRCRHSATGCDDDPDLLRMSGFMLDYPFAERVYPRRAGSGRAPARHWARR